MNINQEYCTQVVAYYNIGTVGIIGGLKWNLGYACCRIYKNCHFEDLKVKCKKLCNYQQDIYA